MDLLVPIRGDNNSHTELPQQIAAIQYMYVCTHTHTHTGGYFICMFTPV